jgi:hypothetical protein
MLFTRIPPDPAVPMVVELDPGPASGPPPLPGLVMDPLPPDPTAWRTDAPPDRLFGLVWIQVYTAEESAKMLDADGHWYPVGAGIGVLSPLFGRSVAWGGQRWQPAVSRSGAYPTAAELDLTDDTLRAMSGQPVDEE